MKSSSPPRIVLVKLGLLGVFFINLVHLVVVTVRLDHLAFFVIFNLIIFNYSSVRIWLLFFGD